MTTEEKIKSEAKEKECFGFPFEDLQGLKEMMRTWCPSGTGFCNCCPMTKMTKDEKSK